MSEYSLGVESGMDFGQSEEAKPGKKEKKGEEWFKREVQHLDDLVNRGNETSRQELFRLAEQHQVPTHKHMDTTELRNKIKAKYREMK